MPKQKQKDIANKNLRKVIDICYEMLELADYGDKFRMDDGCGVVYGTLRDTAYKIRSMTERELSKHGYVKKDNQKETDE